jgi:hypothetical protein
MVGLLEKVTNQIVSCQDSIGFANDARGLRVVIT